MESAAVLTEEMKRLTEKVGLMQVASSKFFLLPLEKCMSTEKYKNTDSHLQINCKLIFFDQVKYK